MTPEGKVKADIDKYLKTLAPYCSYLKPVPCGFGKSGVDYSACYYGVFIAIEAKKKGVKKATPREQAYIDQVIAAGGIGFVADSVEVVIDIMEQVKHVRARR